MESDEQPGASPVQSNDNGPVTWDSEEDHLLSYFLGDSISQHSNSDSKYGADFSNLTISQPRLAPATPAVQFYSSSKSSSVPRVAPVESASSSSSSLSSMAATLVNGGPVLHQIAPRPSNISPPSISPISPAATMGTPQEQLMLPPPPRNKTEADRQQHIAWLNQINTMAMISANNNNKGALHTQDGNLSTVLPQPQITMPPLPPSAQIPPALPPAPPPPLPHQYSPVFRTPQPPAPESEEKRARRLARNRESARQSRRRKKERLVTLSQKVNGLYGDIETERRNKLMEMEDALQKMKMQRVQQQEKLLTREELQHMLDNLGPNCTIRQTAVSFQYPALRQLILPKYQLFMLWMTIQHENFFTLGKEEFAKRENASRANNRVSSKQIGEELTNEWKRGQKKKKTATTSSKQQRPQNVNNSDDGYDDDEEEPESLKAYASDPARLWPLFCFDMSISVDQEEKLVALHAKQLLSLKARERVAQVNTMVMDMKRGILNHLQSTAGRSQNLFLETLEPDQSHHFMTWYAQNAERVKAAKQSRSMHPQHELKPPDGDENKENWVIGTVCKRLKEVLKLPSDDDMTVVKMEGEGN